MGRINLTALRIRRRALANLETERNKIRPLWLDIACDIPPAQIFTRQQPIPHPLTKIRRKTVQTPEGSDALLSPSIRTEVTVVKATRTKKKASQLFQPVPIRYEEDECRKQFYSDHPWELARPRVVLETTGDDSKMRDYSRNVRSPNAPLNGESVVQRQLYLLHNVPDISENQAYDVARKEFYAHRLREEIERRIAVEEAEAVGADFGKGLNQKSLEIEDKMYEDWERWSKQSVLEGMQRSAAFTGQQTEPGPESENVTDTSPEIGDKVFARSPGA